MKDHQLMSIHVNCPACRTTLNVPDHLLGKRVKCPECSTPFDALPEAAPQSPSAEPSAFPAAPPDLPPPPIVSPSRPSGQYREWDDSFGRGRDYAAAQVQPPAIILMVLVV